MKLILSNWEEVVVYLDCFVKGKMKRKVFENFVDVSRLVLQIKCFLCLVCSILSAMRVRQIDY